MKLKSFFPVIATKGVTEARDFYVRYFGFKVVFDAGADGVWSGYISLFYVET